MILPTIHLNGTAAEDLRDMHLKAADAVAVAIDALRLTAPHGRDFYSQDAEFGYGGSAFSIARNEYMIRLVSLEVTLDDLMNIAKHCQEALDEIEARKAKAQS